ncbi:hypothetical protein [Nannocystis sp.]|uniref:hypothetical protein n=1 Tax=Nannocystis sp. TaxID=1962667 RepID=UPI0025D2F52C|nr:hypothetical protein [Nannocystis sp.]MBK7828493.1 hypothetical protein [Nannocystis sp.]
MACPRLHVLLALTVLAACSAGDNSDGTDVVSVSATLGDSTSAASTTTPTTGEPGSTSGDESSGGPASTSTTATPTTGEPGSTSSSDETGPICDPGMPNCVCDNGSCVEGYVCQNDVCGVGLACPDDVEPPVDGEATPVELGDITDNDDDFFEEMGVLSGIGDADWYHLHGADTLGYVAEATFTLVSGSQRHCLFLECDDGGVALTKVNCPGGSDFAISPALRPGCCSAESFQIKDLDCPGNDESLQMWLRVDKPAADVCSPYGFKLHF